jgi:hypothetical protein
MGCVTGVDLHVTWSRGVVERELQVCSMFIVILKMCHGRKLPNTNNYNNVTSI